MTKKALIDAQIKLSIVPFSHLDLSWLGTQKECDSRISRILTEVISKAKRNPDYRFFIDNVHPLERYKVFHPKEFSLLKQLVKEGRVEINPEWAIPYTDNCTGEDNVRNILYAKKFIKENFGVNPIAISYTDLPEWMVQTPQILKKCGIEFLLKSRLGPSTDRLFWWEALDSSRILTCYPVYSYAGPLHRGITVDVEAMKVSGLEECLKSEAKQYKSNQILSFLGVDLWLPVENIDRNVAEWNKISDVKMRMSTFAEYYQKIKGILDLSIYKGEVPNRWIPIMEGSYAKLVQHTQKTSSLLQTAEKVATLNYIISGTDYPAERIERAWKILARSDDHNYDGVGAREGDKTKFILREGAEYIAQDIINESLPPIAEKVRIKDRDCIPIVVFNPLSWERSGLVRTHFTIYPDVKGLEKMDWKGNAGVEKDIVRLRLLESGIEGYPLKKGDKMALKDEDGKQIAFQELYYVHHGWRGEADFVFIAEDVPPLGYKTYYIYPSKDETQMPNLVKVSEESLENQRVKMTINKIKGTITIFDKKLKRTVINDCSVNVKKLLSETTLSQVELPISVKKIEVLERGPIRGKICIEYNTPHPSIEKLSTELSVVKDGDVEIATFIKYNNTFEDILLITQLFPFEFENPKVHYGVPYGHNEKLNLMSRSGFLRKPDYTYMDAIHGLAEERWKTSRTIQKWLDISGKNYGFTIGSSRQLFTIGDEGVECTLLVMNKGFVPGEVIHSGEIVSRFTITPHSGSWRDAKTYHSGWELNTPLIPYTVNDTVSGKSLPSRLSFLSIPCDHTVVTALKKAEDGDGIIVRLFEAEGKEDKTKIVFFRPIKEAYHCNLLEEREEKVNSGDIKIGKNEIKTLNLFFS